jgi:hypothetical protein
LFSREVLRRSMKCLVIIKVKRRENNNTTGIYRQ